MTELTLEALARRLDALEKKIAEREGHAQDWRRVVGVSEDNEFTRGLLSEIEANSEAERQAALGADSE
jgi:hypothetical protein